MDNTYHHHYSPHYLYSPQVGHGLGGVLASLFRSALPFLSSGLRSGVRYMGKKSVTASAKMLNDIIDGDAPKIALKRNFNEMKNDIAQDFKRKLVGRGEVSRPRKRTRITCKSVSIKRKKKSKGKSKKTAKKKKKQKRTVSNSSRRKKLKSSIRRKKTCSNKNPTDKQILRNALMY